MVHSTTKFMSGHGNAMGGAVVDSGKFNWSQNDKFPSLSQPEPAYHGLVFQVASSSRVWGLGFGGWGLGV